MVEGAILSCGGLDGEDSLIVARRAVLVVALLALLSFVAAKTRQRERVLGTRGVLE